MDTPSNCHTGNIVAVKWANQLTKVNNFTLITVQKKHVFG